MNYKFKKETDYKISLQKVEEQEDIIKIKISIDFEKKSTPKPVVIRWTHPCKNVFSQWNPQLWSVRTLNPNWMPIKNGSRSAEGTPLQTHLSLDGINEITVSVSDPLTPMEIATGIVEETAEISYKLTLFTKLVSPMDKYETVLTIDTRKLPYEKVLADTIRLWYEEISVPEASKEPMYSTWYSYHQNLSRHELNAVSNDITNTELYKYYNKNELYNDEISDANINIRRLFVLHNFRKGVMFIKYDCESFNKSGEHIYGSSNVYAKWYIEKKNGVWEVVKVIEKP